jgi:anaerobic ribonucleoside-triphosphate reductase activating protein
VKIALNKIHFPVTTLGHGRRLVFWTQGCSIHCPGCVSRDTWDAAPEHEIEIATLLDSCRAWLAEADGVTISGGEPFDQPEALALLLDGLRARHGGDLLVFSGYPWARLERDHAALLAKIDVVISEPYRADAGQTLALRGSDNQRVSLLTSLARARYPADLNEKPWTSERTLDFVLTNDDLWMAGIPRPGEMGRLKEKLRARGFTCSTSDDPTVRA